MSHLINIDMIQKHVFSANQLLIFNAIRESSYDSSGTIFHQLID